MKRLFLISVFLLAGTAAYAGSVQLNTYYPAPFGNYDRLRLVPRGAPPACDASLEGLLFYDDVTNTINICQDGGSWGSLGGSGVWTKNLNDIYPTDTPSNPNLRVGIGQIPPDNQYRLVVKGDSAAGISSLNLRANQGVDPATFNRIIGFTDEPFILQYGFFSVSSDTFQLGAGNYTQLSLRTNVQDMRFQVGINGAIEALRINGTTGNVGIGTTGPASPLHVNGQASGVPLLILSDPTEKWYIQNDPSGNFYIRALSNNETPFTITRGVGPKINMGSSQFIGKLNVSSGGTAGVPDLFLGLGGSFSSMAFTSYNDNSIQAYVTGTNPGSLLFNPAGGNVGIGTTAPNSTLHVATGYIQFPTITGASPPALDCDTAAEAGRVVVRTDGTVNLYVCTGITGWIGK